MKLSTIKSLILCCGCLCGVAAYAAGASAESAGSDVVVPVQLHGVAVPKDVAAYVQKQEPEKIVVPQVQTHSGDLAQKIEAAKTEKSEAAFEKLIREIKEEKRGSVSCADIPFIRDIPLPKAVKEFFSSIVMYLPIVTMTTKGFSVDGMIDVAKVRVWGRIAVETDSTGKKRYSLAVELPKGWKFSDLFPKTEKFDPTVLDLLQFERAYLVLSSAKYKDPTLKKDIREGLNFLAQVRPAGPFFKGLNALSGGVLNSVASIDMQGVIGLHEQLVGTILEFELPVGLKFTSWMETTKLKVFIALEEKITQIVRPSVGLSGGLKLKLPLQSDFVEFRLTGKYAAPEDLELYGEMNGWLNNVPLKYMSVGDMRIGVMTDLTLIAETAGAFGWISGLNLAGGLGIVDSRFHIAAKGAVDGTTAVEDMTIIIDGSSSLKDMVAFWLYYAEDAAKLFKKDQAFAQAIINKIPTCELKDLHVAFVPRETVEEKKRIEVSVGSVNLFGLQGSGTFYLDKQGVRGKLSIPEIVVGPQDKPWFFVTGVGERGKKGLLFDVTMNPLEQSAFTDIEWGSSVLGGIKYYGRMNLSAQNIEVTGSFKWANLVDSQLMVRTHLLSKQATLSDFSAHMKLQQSGQETFARILKETSQKLLNDLQKQLDETKKKGIKRIEGNLVAQEEHLLAAIAQLEQKISEKKDACDKQFSGIKVGLRPLCYVWKNMPYETIRLLTLKWQRDVILNVNMVSGIVSIEAGSATVKAVTRPLGAVMNFLADVMTNVIVIRQFDAQASFKTLAEKKPATLNLLDMRIAGKDVKLQNISFEIDKPAEFLLSLFDQLQGKKK